MTDKIPEALAVLDYETVIRNDAAIACRVAGELKYAHAHEDSVRELRKVRDAFAELIKAANNILDNVDNGGCCSNVVSEKAQDILYKALAAVEKLP